MNDDEIIEPQLKKFKMMYSFQPFKIMKHPILGGNEEGVNIPKPRSGHRIVYFNGSIYSFGGYSPVIEDEEIIDHILYNELWRFNCATRQWKLLTTAGTAPETLASHCATVIDHEMLVFGGTGVPFGEKSSNEIHYVNLQSHPRSWRKLQCTGSLPLEQYGQSMALHDMKLYVVGGTTGFDYSIDIFCCDLTKSKNQWKHHAEDRTRKNNHTPQPRYRHEIVFHENKIYVFGGGTANESFDLQRIPVFNLETSSWSVIQTENYPLPRKCHGLVHFETDVYICGGFNGMDAFSDIWKFSLKTFTWEKCREELPSPLYFHAVTVTETGKMFVFGGVNSVYDNTRTNELHCMWMKIPSLAEMCWEAILAYVPDISSIDKTHLKRLGIPRGFVNRIHTDV